MTTTPNELRAAAMAVEIHYAEQPKHVWFTDHDDNALKLARHYLSILHPDADEPISEQWLLSEYPRHSRGNEGFVFDGDCDSVYIQNLRVMVNAIWFPSITTRDDLRHLLAALGCR